MRPDEELPLSRKPPVDEDVRRELEFHLRERERELIAAGHTPEQAAAEARHAFGDLDSVAAECRTITRRFRRAIRRAETVESWRQDLVLAWRLLRKTPGFTLAAVVTLALGIGANVSIFSLVNGVLLRPLPYPNPDRLVDIAEAHGQGWGNPPWSNLLDWRDQSRSFDGMASYGSWPQTALTSEGPVTTRSAVVSQDFFRIFGVSAERGRLPTADEHQAGGPAVAVVSHSFWQNRLGSTTDLTQARVRTNREYQVIGVLPPAFTYPSGTDIWVPLESQGPTTNRTAHNWSGVGRLRAGASLSAADRELDSLTARMAELYQPDFDATGVNLTPLQELLTSSTRRPLYLLLGASGLLLLAACTNLASSMLARGMARRQEVAVRIAIGAGRLRIVRQFVTESLLLALLGTLAGVVTAHLLLGYLMREAPAGLRLTGVQLDGWVLLFAGMVGASTTVLIGLFPALRSSGAEPGLALREGTRGGTGRSEPRVWGALVVAEVALAATLLFGSGLLIRSLDRVLSVDPGFRPERVLTASLRLPTAVFSDDPSIERLWASVLDQVRQVPGVEVAGMTSAIPLGGNNSYGSFGIEGVPPGPAGYGPGSAGYRMVSEGYFEAMGIPLLRGRLFDSRDNGAGQPTIVVNQALVDQWFRDQDPIGRRIRLQSGMDNYGDGWLTIVGVVGNVRQRSLVLPPTPETYVPLHQRPTRGYAGAVVLRTRVRPEALVPDIRRVLGQSAPEVVPAFATMEERLTDSESPRQFTALVLSAFALIALLLAGVGIYGVVSYTAVQRTREMGIRLALGALPSQVQRLVQRGAMTQVGLGLLIGGAAALLAAQLMRSLVYDLGASDTLAFGVSAGLLGLVAWLASLLPAWRIARLDPMRTIRSE